MQLLSISSTKSFISIVYILSIAPQDSQSILTASALPDVSKLLCESSRYNILMINSCLIGDRSHVSLNFA